MTSYSEFEGKTAEEAVKKACRALNVAESELKYDVLSYGSTGIFGLVGVKKARIRVALSGEEAAAKEPQKTPRPDERSRRPPERPTPVEPQPPAPQEKEPQKTPRPDEGSRRLPERPTPVEPEPPAPQEEAAPVLTTTSLAPIEVEQHTIRPQAEGIVGEDSEQRRKFAESIVGTIAGYIMAEYTVASRWSAPGHLNLNVEGTDSGMLIGRHGLTLEALQYIVERMVNKGQDLKIRIRVDVAGYLQRREENLVKLALRLGEKVKRTGHPASISPMNAYERRVVHLALKDDAELRTQSKGTGHMRKLVIFPQKKNSQGAS